MKKKKSFKSSNVKINKENENAHKEIQKYVATKACIAGLSSILSDLECYALDAIGCLRTAGKGTVKFARGYTGQAGGFLDFIQPLLYMSGCAVSHAIPVMNDKITTV